MERDFMGLNSKEPVAVVKEEIDDGGRDSGIQWPFSNRVSAFPHFMAPKVAPEGWAKKIGSNPHAPSHESSLCELQKTFNHDRQGGTHFLMAAHSAQHDEHCVGRSHDVKMSSGSNQAVAVSLSNPLFKTHFATAAGHNLAVSNVKEQTLGSIAVTGPHSILTSVGSVPGITDQWNNFKASGAPAQLTIFYKGTVKIYNDISLEKAQAIMLLAGNGSSTASTMGHSRAQAQSPTPKTVVGDGVLVSQAMNTPPCSSPISVSSHPFHQSGGSTTSSDELVAAKPTGRSVTPVNKMEPPNTVNSIGAVAAKTMMPPLAVPQARKASLVRFLEKRKERVMNMAPYNLSRKEQECSTPGA